MESSISNISRREPFLALGIAHILGRVAVVEWEKSINTVKYNALIEISPKNTQPTNLNLMFGTTQKDGCEAWLSASCVHDRISGV